MSIRGKTDLEIRKDKTNARLAHKSDLKVVSGGCGVSYIIEEKDGPAPEYLQLIKEPAKGEDSSVRGIIAIVNNLTRQETLRQELKSISVTDELSGLYNPACFRERAQRIRDEDYPLGVISADCDDLKLVNDRFGHAMGDEYLRMTSTLLKTVLPPNARIFRMGGDEFLALPPTRIRSALRACWRSFRAGRRSFPSTAAASAYPQAAA